MDCPRITASVGKVNEALLALGTLTTQEKRSLRFLFAPFPAVIPPAHRWKLMEVGFLDALRAEAPLTAFGQFAASLLPRAI
jgi:hypothetical protein